MNQNLLSIGQTYFRRHHKILKFLIGGILITVLQVALLYLFTHIFKTWYLFSAQLSFGIAFLVSFIIYRDWVFIGGDKTSHHQFILYTVLTIATFFANGLGMFILVDFLSVGYIFAQILLKAILSVINYFLYNIFIFNK
ncbi:MAG: GtrA family protein [Candidatus Azambacteria bacterium GW2011_GWA1_44_9]|uniref:GtrA family protein n=1 Tax=Candidatus Azambacteria bacterium GW2011_GWA1_44_9 TaxID=1618610 RepID=A0A0G1KB51_9BACT|nr:MAG: GtrA family protein [Candidatus Azambacteria bacterium GW2011_GWA1_44_9]